MDKKEKALEAYRNGCNCAQSVAVAFSDELGLPEDKVYRLMEGFGGGFGGMQDDCGAFSAITLIIGNLNSDGEKTGKTKKDTYQDVRDAAAKYKDLYGSLRCYDILHGQKPQPLKCTDKIENAVEIIEEYIKNKEI